jgi:transposase
MLADRRDELRRARTQTINRIHRLLLELIPGGARQFLSAPQSRALLSTTRPRDVVGKTRRRLAAELITELEGIDRKIKAVTKRSRSWSKPGDPRCCSCTASAPPAPPGC